LFWQVPGFREKDIGYGEIILLLIRVSLAGLDFLPVKTSKAARTTFGIIFEKIGRVIRNPFRIFNIFIYLLYFIILLYYKIRKF
jgi:hypothetical protein